MTDVKLPIGRLIKNTTIGNKGIYNIIFNSDLDTYNYLYYYGENITSNHIKIVVDSRIAEAANVEAKVEE